MRTNLSLAYKSLLVLALATAPAAAQSQADRTGRGGVAGQEFPTEQPVATVAILAGAAALGVLGAVLASHASKNNNSSDITPLVTTTR